MKSLADRVTTDIHDSIDMQAELDRLRAARDQLLTVVGWRLPYAAWPECICQTTHECECNVAEAQANYHPTIKAATALLRAEAEREAKPGGLRAGEFTAEHTGPLTAEQLADKLRDG